MDIVQRIFRAQIQRETSAVHAQQMGGHSSGTKVVNAAVHSLHADGAFKRSAIVKGEVFHAEKRIIGTRRHYGYRSLYIERSE